MYLFPSFFVRSYFLFVFILWFQITILLAEPTDYTFLFLIFYLAVLYCWWWEILSRNVQNKMYYLVSAISFLVTLRLRQLNLPNHIRTKYGADASKQFWRYGDCMWKLRKAQLDVEFLSKCKTFKVYPKFVRFKLYKRCLHTAEFYESWQSILLSREINYLLDSNFIPLGAITPR